MTGAPCMQAPLVTTREAPLTLRYLLHAHRGTLDAPRAHTIAGDFDTLAPLRLVPAGGPHTTNVFERA